MSSYDADKISDAKDEFSSQTGNVRPVWMSQTINMF